MWLLTEQCCDCCELFYMWLLLDSQAALERNDQAQTCTLSGKSPLPQTFSVCSCSPVYPDTLWFWPLTFRGMFLNHLSHSHFAAQTRLGAVSQELAVTLWGDLVSCRLGMLSQALCQGSLELLEGSSRLCRVTEWSRSHLWSPQRCLSHLATSPGSRSWVYLALY